MACGYFKAGVTDHEAVFHVTFRENPFAGQFTVACGLATAIDSRLQRLLLAIDVPGALPQAENEARAPLALRLSLPCRVHRCSQQINAPKRSRPVRAQARFWRRLSRV
jgi:hypothetical protein